MNENVRELLAQLAALTERLEAMNDDCRAFIRQHVGQTVSEISSELGKDGEPVSTLRGNRMSCNSYHRLLIEDIKSYEKDCLQAYEEKRLEIDKYRSELAVRINESYKPSWNQLQCPGDQMTGDALTTLIKQVNEEMANLKYIYLQGSCDDRSKQSKFVLDPLEERLLLLMIGSHL